MWWHSDDLDEQFYAAIAHELKAPLNGVIAPASSLLLDPAVSKDVRKTLKLIKSSGQRLSSLISDIIDSVCINIRCQPWTSQRGSAE